MEKETRQSITHRFIEVISHLKALKRIKSDAEFAKNIGVNPNQLSNIKTGHNKYVTIEMIASTLNVYKDVNPTWILINQGNIFNQPQETTLNIEQIITENIELKSANKTLKEVIETLKK